MHHDTDFSLFLSRIYGKKKKVINKVVQKSDHGHSWWGMLLFGIFGAIGLGFLVQGFLTQSEAFTVLSYQALAQYFIGLVLIVFAKHFKHK